MKRILVMAIALAELSSCGRQPASPTGAGKGGEKLPDGNWGYIDKTGKLVVKPQFKWAHGFSEGMAAVCIGEEWGYVDRTGSFVIKPRFGRANDFSEGLAAVEIRS